MPASDQVVGNQDRFRDARQCVGAAFRRHQGARCLRDEHHHLCIEFFGASQMSHCLPTRLLLAHRYCRPTEGSPFSCATRSAICGITDAISTRYTASLYVKIVLNAVRTLPVQGHVSDVEFARIRMVTELYNASWWGAGEPTAITALPRTRQTQARTFSLNVHSNVFNVQPAPHTQRTMPRNHSRIRRASPEADAVSGCSWVAFPASRSGTLPQSPRTAS